MHQVAVRDPLTLLQGVQNFELNTPDYTRQVPNVLLELLPIARGPIGRLDVIVREKKLDLVRISKNSLETAAQRRLKSLRIKSLGEEAFFRVWLNNHFVATPD